MFTMASTIAESTMPWVILLMARGGMFRMNRVFRSGEPVFWRIFASRLVSVLATVRATKPLESTHDMIGSLTPNVVGLPWASTSWPNSTAISVSVTSLTRPVR